MKPIFGRICGSLVIVVMVAIALLYGFILDYVYFYPLIMSFVWVIGGTFFYLHWERNSPGPDVVPELKSKPLISILIPCYNESHNIAETIEAANNQNYPRFEIIVINDGSTDNTGVILDELKPQYERLRVIHFETNQGKAMALNMGAMVARSEYFVCIDSDALMHPNTIAYMVKPMLDNPRVGAVTGNPRVRTRASLLGRVQVGEFSSIIGLIKRAQRIYGLIFTVSGVIAAFRRRALHDCGYWSLNMSTEDIDISWAMQMKHWQIQYAASAIVWILMPETFVGLWRQRLRWAQGGAEVFLKNFPHMWKWQRRRMWLLMAEFCFSTTWAYAYMLSILLWVLGHYMVLPSQLFVSVIWPPAFWGLVLAAASLMQFATALMIESRYEPKLYRTLFWVIWYPLFFWMLSLLTTLVGLPRAMFRPTAQRAIWHTEDRGFR